MKIEVEVVSRETIKPSSPTPNHLHNYQLSFLDQISPPVYMPLIFFYSANSLTNSEKSNYLKISLSRTLTHFYPLAGRLVDNTSVTCNDEGVPYLEAKAKCQLSEAVSDPVPGEFNKFLSQELCDCNDTLMSVQVTFFQCGGIAIGICVSHKVADGLSVFMFITGWAAAAARGNGNILLPTFESAKLFPPRNLSGYKPGTAITKEKIATKRFVFSNTMVAALRVKFTESTNEEFPIRPTRMEALSTFLWSRFAAVTRADSVSEKHYMVLHAVNLRPRMDPPLPENSFGNLYRIAIATPCIEAEKESCGLVREMRNKIKSIDANYVKKVLREGFGHLDFMLEGAKKLASGEVISFSFTSLCRLPMYEVDFGWGKPVRVGLAKLVFKNQVTFMDTKSGDGIEAWINLDEEDMAKFEVDKELLAYVSPTYDVQT